MLLLPVADTGSHRELGRLHSVPQRSSAG